MPTVDRLNDNSQSDRGNEVPFESEIFRLILTRLLAQLQIAIILFILCERNEDHEAAHSLKVSRTTFLY